MDYYGFEYFSGANVALEIDNFTVTEAVAISYSIGESKIPLYGYASRFFDAVANGRVLVQGSLIINFVHQDYLFRLIQVAKRELAVVKPSQVLDSQFNTRDMMRDIQRLIQEGGGAEGVVSDALKQKIWDQAPAGGASSLRDFTVNPHDRGDSVNIKITFGERNLGNMHLGKTNTLLSDVFFVGRGMEIQISQDVILEQYNFFARNVETLDPGIARTYIGGDNPSVTTSSGN